MIDSYITKFRINVHQLAIERGRFRNIKAEERICNFGQEKEVEVEMHFLIKCFLVSMMNYLNPSTSPLKTFRNL